MRRMQLAFMAVTLATALGCGRGPKTYPVEGRVEVVGADLAILAGSFVEAARVDDPSDRASGVIEADGSFTLETQRAGSIYRGAPAGKYQVRILLGDDDRKTRQRAQKALPTRYLAFQTSGLVLDVPTGEDVTLVVSSRSNARSADSGKTGGQR